MRNLIVNTLQFLRNPFFLGQAGLNEKRSASWAEFGYKTDLQFEDFKLAYDRYPAASGAIGRIVGKCWETLPRIKASDAAEKSDWENAFDAFMGDKDRNFWPKLVEADKRNLVGRYSAILLQVADNIPLNQPVGKGKLIKLLPVWENQLRVCEWNQDPQSEQFAMPAMYEYLSSPKANQSQGQPHEWQKIHPSRLITLAEGSAGGTIIDGIPFLRAGFNKLIDLEKVSGGGAEGFLKNASRSVVLEFDKDAQVAEDMPDGKGGRVSTKRLLDDQIKSLNRNTDSAIMLQGGTATTLNATQIQPKETWEICANEFACSVQLPFTILFGQQTGRLASDQDQVDFANVASSRRINVLNDFLETFVYKLIEIGELKPIAKVIIEWDDLKAPSEQQKLERADAMSKINKTCFDAGEGSPFSPEEIREAAGYEPVTIAPRIPDAPPTGDKATGGTDAGN